MTVIRSQAMMKRQDPVQSPLFRPGFEIGSRVPKDHLLRQISAVIDFDFVYDEVEECYGEVGNPSVPPPVVLKLLLLLFLYRVPSERELMATLPMRLDWLWFLGYDLDTKVPNHSVLSKARRRWTSARFNQLFLRILHRCELAGLIGGTDVFVDSSLIDANASIDSLFTRDETAKAVAAEISARLDEVDESPKPVQESATKPAKYVSKTDPDATGSKHGKDKMRPRYATHRVVDELHGVITGTVMGPGHQDEGERLIEVLDQHEQNTKKKLKSATADSKYGRIDNYEACEARGIELIATPRNASRTKGKPDRFGSCEFRYDPAGECYICPAGEKLVRTQKRPDRNGYRYTAPSKACRACPVRQMCTSSRRARSITRRDGQDLLDRMAARAKSESGRKRRKKRFAMMEGSFAISWRFGFKRARWRGLERVAIQDYLVAIVQNIVLLVRHTSPIKTRISTVYSRAKSLLGSIRAVPREIHQLREKVWGSFGFDKTFAAAQGGLLAA